MSRQNLSLPSTPSPCLFFHSLGALGMVFRVKFLPKPCVTLKKTTDHQHTISTHFSPGPGFPLPSKTFLPSSFLTLLSLPYETLHLLWIFHPENSINGPTSCIELWYAFCLLANQTKTHIGATEN